MKIPEEINKAKRPYTYIQTDDDGIVQFSTNSVIIQGQQLFSRDLPKEEYDVQTREGYKIMAYRSPIGYINAVALPDNMYQDEINEINEPFDYDWEYRRNENRGIGLCYVKAMLDSFYEGQMNVLIVDDDKLARKGLIAIMNWEKYGLRVAGDVQNGRKALEFLRNNPVDIVFTDIDIMQSKECGRNTGSGGCTVLCGDALCPGRAAGERTYPVSKNIPAAR